MWGDTCTGPRTRWNDRQTPDHADWTGLADSVWFSKLDAMHILPGFQSRGDLCSDTDWNSIVMELEVCIDAA